MPAEELGAVCGVRCASDGTVGGCGGRGRRRRQLLLLGSWLINAL